VKSFIEKIFSAVRSARTGGIESGARAAPKAWRILKTVFPMNGRIAPKISPDENGENGSRKGICGCGRVRR
jgi:hypothetical protein